jgi:HEAT repeat protein/PBS lyase HEAT-like repeat-containing protein
MLERTRPVSGFVGLLVLVPVLVSVLACEKDPNDPQTWIDKLDDRSSLNEALHHLSRLNDPRSIKPLGDAWKKGNRSQPSILRAMIDVAGHPGADGKAQWGGAIPYLIEAVDQFDGNARSADDAVVACDALGRSGAREAVDTVLKAAKKSYPYGHPGNGVRLACILALGKFRDPRVGDTLIAILEEPPAPKLARINGGAALALAESGDPKALPALIKAMIFISAITPQVRPAIARIGKPAIPPLMDLLQHKNKEVEDKVASLKWNDQGTGKGMIPGKAPGNVVFKAAAMLGDLRAHEAVPLLTEELRREPKIAFYNEQTNPPTPGPTTHQGVLGALQAILDPQAAPTVRAYMVDPKTDDGVRPLAIEVYGWLAPANDTSGLGDLQKWIKDENAEPGIREAAIRAWGRIARTGSEAAVMDAYVAEYDKKIKAAEDKGAAAKKDEDKAIAERERAVASYWHDVFAEAKQRISVVTECKDDAACYAAKLPPKVKDFKPGQPGMPRAERALLELARMGQRGASQVDAVLQGVDTSDRFVRQAILLTLPRLAPLPCPKCVDRLGQVIEAQQNTNTLDFLTGETKVVHNYYKSAAASK